MDFPLETDEVAVASAALGRLLQATNSVLMVFKTCTIAAISIQKICGMSKFSQFINSKSGFKIFEFQIFAKYNAK